MNCRALQTDRGITQIFIFCFGFLSAVLPMKKLEFNYEQKIINECSTVMKLIFFNLVKKILK